MSPQAPDLNPAELEILGILWDRSPLKPADIEAAFSRPIENATLRSILRGLVEKNFLRRERQGKAYFYKPARTPRAVRRKLTDKLASVFAEGSRLGLIAQLIEDERLTPEQIRELEQIANKGR
jgi:predicted transcriptional regulator